MVEQERETELRETARCENKHKKENLLPIQIQQPAFLPLHVILSAWRCHPTPSPVPEDEQKN